MDRDPHNDTAWALVARLSPDGTRHGNLSPPSASPPSILASEIASLQFYEADEAYARACGAYKSSFHPHDATPDRYRVQPRGPTSSASSVSSPSYDELFDFGSLLVFSSSPITLDRASGPSTSMNHKMTSPCMLPMISLPFLFTVWVPPH
jgi:hypothetical protein